MEEGSNPDSLIQAMLLVIKSPEDRKDPHTRLCFLLSHQLVSIGLRGLFVRRPPARIWSWRNNKSPLKGSQTMLMVFMKLVNEGKLKWRLFSAWLSKDIFSLKKLFIVVSLLCCRRFIIFLNNRDCCICRLFPGWLWPWGTNRGGLRSHYFFPRWLQVPYSDALQSVIIEVWQNIRWLNRHFPSILSLAFTGTVSQLKCERCTCSICVIHLLLSLPGLRERRRTSLCARAYSMLARMFCQMYWCLPLPRLLRVERGVITAERHTYFPPTPVDSVWPHVEKKQ